MRRVQEILSSVGGSDTAETDQSLAPLISALGNKRLTFAWLDGEAQEVSFIIPPFLCLYISVFCLFPGKLMILISVNEPNLLDENERLCF